MSNQNPLGKLAKEGAVRDAVHVPIYPLEAGEKLSAKDDIVIGKDGRAYLCAVGDQATGIADPFLKVRSAIINEGDWFYICLYPNTVTGMVHHWAHPDFDNKTPDVPVHPEIKKAKEWLTYAAAHIEDHYGVCTFERLMDKARDEWLGEDYATAGFNSAMDFMNDNHVEFWRNYDIYTGGVNVNESHPTSFGCSC